MGICMEEFYKLINDVSVSSMVSLEDFLEQNYEIGFEPRQEGERKDQKVILNLVK